MKTIFLLLFGSILILGCNPKISTTNPTPSQFSRKKVAVLPVQIHTRVNELPENISMTVVDSIEQRKSFFIQLHLYRYMLREYAKSTRRVKLQKVDDTNKILKEKGLGYDEVFKLSKRDLAKILKVDVLIYGSVYQIKHKLDLEEKKTWKTHPENKISTVIYAYGKNRKEKLLWKDGRAISGFPGDYGGEAIKNCLRKSAREFPF